MRIKALHVIRFEKKRYLSGSVLEIDDVRAQALIVQGFAQEAGPREQVSDAEAVQAVPTETLITEVLQGKKGSGRGKR